ncbi:hypothetical protein [Polyangium aurulentum]|uniref:hypothetical protein n=1 Tax=Polyangium aurulentum TaxID=2567896 RepID=UPI0010AE9405|nr:hypothetical protein [Polyangium aurulentum]UQA56112.1 hypothetical protein E8A73_033020 [Polyangium aurulentum]
MLDRPRALASAALLLAGVLASACGVSPETPSDHANAPAGGDDTASTGSGLSSHDAVSRITVRLVPQSGVTGRTRVSFAVPLPRGALNDASRTRVLAGGVELSAARRALAMHPDGSVRSVQIQVDIAIGGAAAPDLEVVVGAPHAAKDLAPVPVEDTLVVPDGTQGPRVWAILPPSWLSASGVVGPMLTEDETAGTAYAAWSDLCDYDAYDIDAFLPKASTPGVWLYDRGTVFYRGHARRGDLETLRTAYRETAIYRSKLTGKGQSTRNGVPDRGSDPRYSYTQNMAIHYLMTGDDRFRESAEDLAEAMASFWPEGPGYHGELEGLWTERHAGFTLLAYTFASIVSDDRRDHFRALADAAVAAFLDVQEHPPKGYADANARCFAVFAGAHKEGSPEEDYGYFGCSPWMSAILADALDAHATERGGEAAEKARASIVKLGRILARDGRDAEGRPFYWMGVGTTKDEPDPDDEHWGESAYVIAMAYHHDEKQDPALAKAVSELSAGLAKHGDAPHMRSFNWQCRSAPATGWFMMR